MEKEAAVAEEVRVGVEVAKVKEEVEGDVVDVEVFEVVLVLGRLKLVRH